MRNHFANSNIQLNSNSVNVIVKNFEVHIRSTLIANLSKNTVKNYRNFKVRHETQIDIRSFILFELQPDFL